MDGLLIKNQPGTRHTHHPSRGDALGLSIARAIATAHDATITAQTRPGGGLAIDVTFPQATPPQTRQLHAGRAAHG